MKRHGWLDKVKEVTVTFKLAGSVPDEEPDGAPDGECTGGRGRELDYSVWVKGLSGRYFCLRCAEPYTGPAKEPDGLPDTCPTCGALMIKAKYKR